MLPRKCGMKLFRKFMKFLEYPSQISLSVSQSVYKKRHLVVYCI